MQTVGKKKMLYIMGVDWDWIYQRPQVIAEYLSQDYEITVAFPVKIWDRHSIKNPRNERTEIHKLKLWVFPFQRKSKLIGMIADKYKRFQLRNYQQYEYIYIDYPVDIEYITEDYRGCLIYDCIDNHEQMCSNEYMRRKVVEDEEILMQRSDIVIVSSQKLLQKRANIYSKKLHLVRNGTSYTKIYDVKDGVVKKHYIIGYIGTIAEWFDQELLLQSAQKHIELEYHLIGPCTISNQVRNSRIIYDGIVEHTKLQLHVKDYDCMIMPFVVNEIVKAVDPVKLYEYIAFGKCIISVYYEELEYFRDYIYFYKTEEEYNSLIETLIQQGFPPKYNSRQQENFLKENNWNERYKVIRQLVEQMHC